MTLSVVVIGAGPIGLGVAREIVARPSTLSLAGLVDADPKKIGTTVEGVPVRGEIPPGASVAVLTTTSSLHKLEPLALSVIQRGMHIVSTCEQLAWPWTSTGGRDEVARRIDAAARQAGVAVLGTGVNPGFVMDALPLALTAPCRRVDRVRVERVQDASTRRRPFQDKVGVGMERSVVEAKLKAREMGHVGLEESALMLGAKLGLGVDAFTEELSVIVADRDVSAHGRRVEAGQVLGVEQVGRATASGKLKVELYFRATFGADVPGGARDRIVVEGEPNLDVTVNGGYPGDIATCAIVANAIPVVVDAKPGLRTMADIPMVIATR